jgi:hypothetical protein
MLIVSWLGIFGFAGIPLGIPPLPEDPVISRVAPENCLYYWSSAGVAAPDPNSANHTEQLLAEKEIQHLLKTIETQILEAIRREAPGPEQAAMANDATVLVKAGLTRPMAIFASSFVIGEKGPEVEGGLVLNAGDQAAEIEAILKRFEQRALEGEDLQVQEVEAGGETWRVLPIPEPAPPVAWTVKGKYLVIGIGKDAGPAILERAKSGPPAWLTKLKQDMPVDRLSTIGYVNIVGIKRSAGPFLDNPMAQSIIQAAGMQNATYLASVTGLDKSGCVSQGVLALDGEAQGALSAIEGKPLSKRDFAKIPADAVFAAAARVDSARVFETVLEIVGQFNPGAVEQMQRELGQIEEILGASLQRDILPAIGDVWTVSSSPSGGGFPWLGAVATVSVNDRATLEKVHDRLIAIARHNLPDPPERRRAVTIRDIEVAGQKVYYLNSIGEEMPFAPAWCLTDDALVVGLFPQAVRTYLTAEVKETLADVPAVADALAASESPYALTYVDSKAMVNTLYPLVQIGAQFLCSEIQREGVRIDISLLPSAETITKHLQPGVSVATKTADGFRMTSHQTLPVGSAVGTIPLTMGFMMPAVGSARAAARSAQDMNNLKQIALAMHNYHATFNAFPAAYIADKEGKPLLSWRVAILPFIEETNLYDQFKLDEPWDSEHNKKLLPLMPQVYASIDAPLPPGETRMVTIRGKETVFPGKDKTSLAKIRDGTSNTIMVVQAGPQAAVEWTKPDDLDFTLAKLRQGLNNGRGFFLAAFCDGSVRRIGTGIGDKALKAVITKDGGEAINTEDLDAHDHDHAHGDAAEGGHDHVEPPTRSAPPRVQRAEPAESIAP